jgi:starch synthase
MYSQRYGTIPLVRRVGGLADSVIDYRDDAPTGVHFEHSDAGGVSYAVRTALSLYAQPERWRSMQINGMRHDWGWPVSARRYLALYERLQIADQGGGGPR